MTCALGTSGAKSIAVEGGRARESMSGGRPSSDSMRAPMRSSGTMMRRIGRRCSESSPVIVVANGWPARMPASIRMVLPELPASSGAPGARQAAQGRGPSMCERQAAVGSRPVSSMVTPSARRQRSVDAQSAPVE